VRRTCLLGVDRGEQRFHGAPTAQRASRCSGLSRLAPRGRDHSAVRVRGRLQALALRNRLAAARRPGRVPRQQSVDLMVLCYLSAAVALCHVRDQRRYLAGIAFCMLPLLATHS
jgi:hypothetical protein